MPKTLTYRFVNWSVKGLLRKLCRVDDAAITQVPLEGPLILVVNHVNFLDAPLVFTHLQPRKVTALVKVETWSNPLLGPLFTLWEGIPIRRGEVDLSAFKAAQGALKSGKILAIAPEGTRSGNGRLGQGLPGVALLAAKTGVPLLPLVMFGGEDFWENIKHLRRTDFHIVVGEPFRLELSGKMTDKEALRQATDEVMFRLAELLPPEYRGVYSDLDKATRTYLQPLALPAG